MAAVASAVAWFTIVMTEPAATVLAVPPFVVNVNTPAVDMEIVPIDTPSSWTSRFVVAVADVPIAPAELPRLARNVIARTATTLIMISRFPGTPENDMPTSYGIVRAA